MIQDREYERLKQQGEELPNYKTGMWWTTRLIRLIIYFALNEWQVQNDHLHEKKEQTEREVQRTRLKEMTCKMYEAHRHADHPTLRRYFRRPYLETITAKEISRLEYWLTAVTTLYDEEAKTEGSIRKILDDLGITIDDIHQTDQAEE